MYVIHFRSTDRQSRRGRRHGTKSLRRRIFLKGTAAAGCMSAASLAFGLSRQSEKSDAFRLVSETDRERILKSADKYISQVPFTITAFPAPRSAGGLHDFHSQADYFRPNPKDPNGPLHQPRRA